MRVRSSPGSPSNAKPGARRFEDESARLPKPPRPPCAAAESRFAGPAPSRPPPQLETLAAGLAAGLRESGFTLEERAFAAHVTLARRARRNIDGALPVPVTWEAMSFALVESDLRTGRYETRGSWMLGTR